MTRAGAISRGPSAGFRYLPVGRFFLNGNASLLRAWRVLWAQQSEFLGSEGKQVDDAVARDLPSRALATTKLMLRYLFARFGRPESGLTLPLSGDLAIERLSGAVKLLDLEGHRVYTLMPNAGSHDKLEGRIAAAKRVGQWPFAPRYEGSDLSAGWLAEEHIAGAHPTNFRGCRECFDDYYLPLLSAFIRAEEPSVVGFDAYLTRLYDDILAVDGLLTKVEPGLRAEITAFVEGLRARLAAAEGFAGGDIALALSHGDFFSGNVILAPESAPRAIDWATSGTRSPLHDLYYLVMNHCVRVMTPHERSSRFGQMLAALRARLAVEAPATLAALDRGLSDAPALRWLFYLECVQVPLVHCDDPEDRYIRSLATRIGWFKEFELAMEGQS